MEYGLIQHNLAHIRDLEFAALQRAFSSYGSSIFSSPAKAFLTKIVQNGEAPPKQGHWAGEVLRSL
jgi:hypothetical protein